MNSGGKSRQSEFDRLGPSQGNDRRDLGGIHTNHEALTDLESDVTRHEPAYSYLEVEEGEIDDDVHDNNEDNFREGVDVAETRMRRYRDGTLGDTKTGQGRRSHGTTSRRESDVRMQDPASSSRKRQYTEVQDDEADYEVHGNNKDNLREGVAIAGQQRTATREEPIEKTHLAKQADSSSSRNRKVFIKDNTMKRVSDEGHSRLHPRKDDDDRIERIRTHSEPIQREVYEKPGCSFWGKKKGERDNSSRSLNKHKPKSREHFKSQDVIIKEQATDDLKRLAYRDTGKEIAVWLVTRPEALKTIVDMNAMNNDETERLVRVLAKACTETMYFEGLLKIVLPVVADSTFFRNHLLEWIMKVRFSAETEATVSDICTICSSILQQFPNKYVGVALVVSLLYTNYDSQYRMSESAMCEETLFQIRKLNGECNATLHNLQTHQGINRFRNISIIPDPDEIRINVRPTMNRNLKQGAYASVDIYLDTQFRLLREDFVAPMRAGTCSFIRQQHTRNAGEKVDDVRVYRNVRILQPICGSDGVSHRIQFSLQGWNPRRLASKKLLRYGSLVCLSTDGFSTLHYGMVTNCDALTQGVVDILFQEPASDGDIYNREYVMAESEAFFEAYRPVLKGLQQITDQTLPLQNYIIKTSDKVTAPRYLLHTQDVKYDLQSLFKPEVVVKRRKSSLVRSTAGSPARTPQSHSHTSIPSVDNSTYPLHSPTSPSYSQQFPVNFPSTHECEQVVYQSHHRNSSSDKVQSSMTSEKENTGLNNLSMIGRKDVRAPEATSTFGGLEVPEGNETSGTGENKITALDKLSTIGEKEVRAPEATSTFGEMEVTIEDGTSVTGEKEVTALDELSTIGEKEVRAPEATSTFGKMEVTIEDGTSVTGEKEVTALDGLSTIDEGKITTVEARKSDDYCPTDPRKIPLLRFEKWPDESVLGLDESQRRAVYSALTQEFAVIQGPPGTGKTYVGLKIMKVLLDKNNCKVWSREKTGPILVVCYTNHALDQFLEGVIEFEKNIVRIGGRSKSEKLQRYNLKHLKKTSVRCQGKLLNRDKVRLYETRDITKSEIEKKVQDAYSFNTSVVSFEELESVMNGRHSCNLLTRASKDVGIMTMWLDLELFTKSYSGILCCPKTVADETSRCTTFGDTSDDRMIDDELDRPCSAERKSANALKEWGKEDFVLDKFKCSAEKEEDDSTKLNKLETFKFIEQMMQSSDRMSQEEADNVGDVWGLDLEARWKLYRYWVDAYRSHCLASTNKHIDNYNRYTQAIKEMENDEICQVLSNVKVIGMTTTGAAKWQSVLQRIGPRIVVVEEAAEVMEAHVIATLSQHCQHLILIGDHQQLKPNPAVYRLAKDYNLDISLFERMVNNNFPCQMLSRQHRMRPEIADIMRNHFYKDLQDDVSVLHMEDVRGVSKNMFFIDHKYIEDNTDDGMKSHSSMHEVDMTVALCKYLLQQGYSPEQLVILTVYAGQLLSIKTKLNTELHVEGVRVCVVDNFQGEECDIVLLSLVRSNQEGKIGFLQIHNRICVMLSRAKRGLFCIGNFNQLAAKSDKWKSITDEMRERQLLGNSLVLACPLHPDVETEVACAADFKKVPEGGCMRPCEYRLPCGHVCTRRCHPDDRRHNRFICVKPCERFFCEANHKCPNVCGEQCPKICERPVKKQLPGCTHVATMKCYDNPEYISCREKCLEKLPCGHACRDTCGNLCNEKPCVEQVLRTDLPCGHQEYMPCSDEASQCPALCQKFLACGHTCPGKCSSCYAGRLHVSCRQKCGRILVCGHKCRQPCASNCPPCTEWCKTRCIHSACEKKCSEPCAPCMEPCSWRCRHHKCGKKCSEPCDRPPCDKPCEERLEACGHRCIGMCGEPCPSKCRVCHKNEVTEIFFGTEDEDDAHFVELRDCGHIFEVQSLDQCMKQDDNPSPQPASGDDHGVAENEPSTVSVKLKVCPKCSTTIRRSTRYNRFINDMLADIERVKGQVMGDYDQITSREREIRSMLSKIKESNHFAKATTGLEAAAKTLRSQTSLHDLIILLNQTNFATEVVKLEKQLNRVSNQSTWYKKTSMEISQVARRLFNPARPFRGTEQELLDFPKELSRLHLCCKACSILQTGGLQLSQNKEDLQSQIDTVNGVLFTGKPLSVDNEKEILELLTNLRKTVGGLGIDDETRVMIVKVIGLSKGHWYKCPTGHIYAIGECGGATERGQCPECGSEIGGESHRLASGNAVASEMDGAQFAS